MGCTCQDNTDSIFDSMAVICSAVSFPAPIVTKSSSTLGLYFSKSLMARQRQAADNIFMHGSLDPSDAEYNCDIILSKYDMAIVAVSLSNL